MEMEKTLGERIKETRKRVGMSQQKVADALGISSFVAISQWEQGKRTPKPENIRRIAAALGVSVNEFFDFSEEERKQINSCEQIILRSKKAIQGSVDPEVKKEYEDQITLAEEILDDLIMMAKARYQAEIIYQKSQSRQPDAQTGIDYNTEVLSQEQTDYGKEILSLMKQLSESKDMSYDEKEKWKKLQSDILKIVSGADTQEHENKTDALLSAYSRLNEDGKKVAIERLNELAYVPAYSLD